MLLLLGVCVFKKITSFTEWPQQTVTDCGGHLVKEVIFLRRVYMYMAAVEFIHSEEKVSIWLFVVGSTAEWQFESQQPRWKV